MWQKVRFEKIYHEYVILIINSSGSNKKEFNRELNQPYWLGVKQISRWTTCHPSVKIMIN